MNDSSMPGVMEDAGWEWQEAYLCERFFSEQTGQDMNIDDIYSKGSHLKASDLSRDVSVTISSYEVVDFPDGSKVVLKFQGKDKDLVLNRINGQMISEMYGKNIDNWIGKPITVGPDRTPYNGQMVACIRVRYHPPGQMAPQSAPASTETPAPAESAPNDDIPF